MTCDFMPFPTVFHLYLDDGQMIMKGVCNATLFMIEKIPASSKARTQDRKIRRPVLNLLPLSYIPGSKVR